MVIYLRAVSWIYRFGSNLFPSLKIALFFVKLAEFRTNVGQNGMGCYFYLTQFPNANAMNHLVRGDARCSQRFRDGLVDAPMGLGGIKKSAGFGPADSFMSGKFAFLERLAALFYCN
jgi:hypothetical protein